MQTQNTRREVKHVLIITLVLNLLVAFGKIGIGMVSGALAITADGFHSLMDGASNIAGLIANHYAAQPPDDDHPYGHRRFETLAAMLIGALLLVTAWEIAGSALSRLRDAAPPALTPLTFAVLSATLLGNIAISRYQIRRGKQLRSELLLADAANTSTDVYVTLSVIVSMGIVAFTGWAWVDLAAALVVVMLICKAAWTVIRPTWRVLVDTAPYTSDDLNAIVAPLSGVDCILRSRSRGSMDAAHIDIDVQVQPTMTVSQTATIRDTIERRLHTHLDGISEIEVHFVPAQSHESLYTRIA